MAQIDHKHPNMTLYLEKNSPITHWISIVLAEKTVVPNTVFVDSKKLPNEVARINPHGVLPFLVDQEGLRLYAPHIIAEYLDERFPHPPLLPIYPIARSKCRQTLYQILKEWYGLLDQISVNQDAQEVISMLKEGLLKFAPIFEVKPYFLSDELNLVDCCMAALLFRLQQMNLLITDGIPSIQAYQTRLFEQPSFQSSLRQLSNH